MIRDALEQMAAQAVRANGPQQIYEDERTVYFLISGTTVAEYDKRPPTRSHAAASLKALAYYGSEDTSVIWHHGNTVTLIIDDSEADPWRENYVNWQLNPSEKLDAVKNAAKPRGHRDFINYVVQNLRNEFEGCCPGTLGILRNLKFQTSESLESDVSHGRESMGNDIKREVSGVTGDILPETVTLKIRRWVTLDILVPIECQLIIDYTEKTLCLKPLADQFGRAELDAHEQLAELISTEIDVPILYGSDDD